MFLKCNVSGAPALGLQQATPPASGNEATMFTESMNHHQAHCRPTSGAQQKLLGVTINIFINPSPKSSSEIHLDTWPTLIFIHSFYIYF